MKNFKFFIGYGNNFDHLVMPEVRVHREVGLIANDLVPVQPMEPPIGRLLYVNSTYNEPTISATDVQNQLMTSLRELQEQIDELRRSYGQ